MPTQFEKAQVRKNQQMKRSRDIYGIFKKNSKLSAENIETLSQKAKGGGNFFSKSWHDRVGGQWWKDT